MKENTKRTMSLTLAAIGIVYGDLGTSPLYAFRESLKGLEITPDNILGVLSLIFWSLISIISIKYLIFVLRADNDGEGGILSMLALVNKKKIKKVFFSIAVFGAALLIGDGIITPAISVTSAIEGLEVISPALAEYTVPISLIILMVLYFFQYHGTAKIGLLFGPIIVLWFLTIGTLGALHLNDNPLIFQALNPYYAVYFLTENGITGFILLGAVFLVVTGGEALYADLGQFGRFPIRLGWFGLALPALLLNYFGQGAYVLNHPEAIVNPFYELAPKGFAYPLLFISTLATIVASQAVISATFSITKQAILLDLFPKIRIVQTSSEEKGQVYSPKMNFFLAIATLSFVLAFRTSSNMAFAYGIAVNLHMICVSILLMYIASALWKWSWIKIAGSLFIFFLIEMTFLAANAHKILSGGWVPILFGMVCLVIMITWYQGIQSLRKIFRDEEIEDFNEIISEFEKGNLHYLPDASAIFITEPYHRSTSNLLHYFKLNHTFPGTVLIVHINNTNEPYISSDNRYELKQLNQQIYRMIIHVGFMQLINIPYSLSLAKKKEIFPFELDLKSVSYLVEITQISATQRKSTLPFYWQEKLFAFLMRNSTHDIEFYHLPYNRTIAIGSYCEF
ncbi:KUP/HAK/KT family potassium transporter [Candidatus Berkiella aquae]|uniref:Probable potassium transport system protein Kup n=1 Tax=Candidatus Berkiella aquae TaxID=295108 RepID=A0A0Q9YJS0_9GAMM|nr:KUP/HAK/KT family potassium transporter [Candidatus Berkiella aquae]MCS5710624.1 KUP/HAK/KT family potassium transporter [Candidatus Berkiella aquae]